MTRQKSLKSLVRKRMTHTGESYTTARRHLLAQQGRAAAPAFPPGVLAGYTATGGGTHHPSALLRNVLAQRGVRAPHTGTPYSEAMLAGLGGGIGFLYAVFEYRDFPYPTMTVVAQHHPEPFLPAALTRLGATHQATTTTSAKVAARRLAEALDAGLPAVCTVDRAGLPWHAVENGFSGDPYEVAVIGRDGDAVYLDDVCVRPNPLAHQDFLAAWGATAKHRLLTVTDAPEVDLAAAVRDAVATTVAHLTGPVLGHAYDVNFGLSGMGRLVAALGDRTGRKGWSTLFGGPAALFWGLRRLHDCLELEYTAPGATRPLYAEFLTEAAPLVGDDRYLAAAALFRTSGEHWSALAAHALSAAPALTRYDDLAERKLTLMITGGDKAEIRAVSREMAALPAAYEAAPLGDDARDKVLDRLHDHADAAMTAEREAVALLSRARS
ncbi:BtrH N-terminal domain-containing protein [Actinokineospora sp.]|uniref:BtrH N-terminal domain-containing protein n=1 Tax=Actinokineospora sp. TaxID=1872133 RepID=UPI004037933B